MPLGYQTAIDEVAKMSLRQVSGRHLVTDRAIRFGQLGILNAGRGL